jgi:PQQ system protein
VSRHGPASDTSPHARRDDGVSGARSWPAGRSLLALLALAACSACEYVRLLRPSVLKQLNPPTARLVNFLPNVDQPNKAMLARLFATGGLAEARVGGDGVMHGALRIRQDQLVYEPAIIVMPHSGEMELAVRNEDEAVHVLYLPSNGQRQVLLLPQHKGGTARIRLDEPGLYTIACPVSNHAGRGELGVIIVRGEVPASARLDRPAQRRPGH